MNLVTSLFRQSKSYSLIYSGQATAHRQAKRTVSHLGVSLSTMFFVVVSMLLTVNLTAQDSAEARSFSSRTDFRVGYFGNLLSNQGLHFGAEYLWLEKEKVKAGRKGQKIIKRQLLVNGSLGYSTNFATQTQNGLFAYSGLILRRVNAKSRELSVEFNPLGVYRSLLPNTYEVQGDDVRSVSLPGRSYYAPSVAFGVGRFRRATKRAGWYLNFQYTVVTNYNTGILPIFSLHFGSKLNFNKK